MYDVWTSYAELNAELKEQRFSDSELLDNDKNVEDPALIVGVRKWMDSGLSEGGPDWPLQLGFDMDEHVALNDKYDLFIYTR